MDLWESCSHSGKRGCCKLSGHNIQQGLQSPALRDVAHHAKQWSACISHPIPEVPWELGVRDSKFPMRSDLVLMRDNLAGSVTNIENQTWFSRFRFANGSAKHCTRVSIARICFWDWSRMDREYWHCRVEFSIWGHSWSSWCGGKETWAVELLDQDCGGKGKGSKVGCMTQRLLQWRTLTKGLNWRRL